MEECVLLRIPNRELNMRKIIPLSQARQNLPELVKQIKKSLDRVIITRRGAPAAVLLAFEDYEAWIETFQVLRNPSTWQSIRKGLTDLNRRRGRSFRDVFGEDLYGKSDVGRLSMEAVKDIGTMRPVLRKAAKEAIRNLIQDSERGVVLKSKLLLRSAHIGPFRILHRFRYRAIEIVKIAHTNGVGE